MALHFQRCTMFHSYFIKSHDIPINHHYTTFLQITTMKITVKISIVPYPHHCSHIQPQRIHQSLGTPPSCVLCQAQGTLGAMENFHQRLGETYWTVGSMDFSDFETYWSYFWSREPALAQWHHVNAGLPDVGWTCAQRGPGQNHGKTPDPRPAEGSNRFGDEWSLGTKIELLNCHELIQ